MWPLTLLLFVNTMWEDKINNSSGIDSAIWAEIPDPGKFSTFYKTGKRKKKIDTHIFNNLKMFLFSSLIRSIPKLQ